MQSDEHNHEDLHERLVRLEERLKAMEAAIVTRAEGGPGPKYYESGTIHPEMDDQTITP
ncbi:MAG: hypothetical protein M3Y04_07405 [Actinomycetota bacterium]|nr:hypothetical protein [Actinomycetota bacterium]